jgi:prepilin-type N-terminal cleavage/methylation domain-containing protein
MSPSGRRGTTLVELMVALAISGAVVTASYGLLANAIRAEHHSRTARRAVLTVVGPRAQLSAWMRGATATPLAPFEGRHLAQGPLSLDELTFSVDDGGPTFPGPRRLHLWIDTDPATDAEGLIAEVSELRGTASILPETLSVAPGAIGLEARFGQFSRGAIRWTEAYGSSTTPPDVIALHLALGASADSQPASTLLALPIVTPVGLSAWH